MNDYSIHENHCSTPYNMKNNSKNISKLSILSKQSHLFCKEAINNDNPTLFFKVYDYNFKLYSLKYMIIISKKMDSKNKIIFSLIMLKICIKEDILLEN